MGAAAQKASWHDRVIRSPPAGPRWRKTKHKREMERNETKRNETKRKRRKGIKKRKGWLFERVGPFGRRSSLAESDGRNCHCHRVAWWHSCLVIAANFPTGETSSHLVTSVDTSSYQVATSCNGPGRVSGSISPFGTVRRGWLSTSYKDVASFFFTLLHSLIQVQFRCKQIAWESSGRAQFSSWLTIFL